MHKKLHNTKGATATEYGILLALLGVVSVGAILFLGQKTQTSFDQTNTSVQNSRPNTNNGSGGAGGPGGGNGNGNTPSVPTLPDETLLTCVTDATGPDNFQEASGSKGYTFPGNCLLITNDGAATFIADNALHTPLAYYIRLAADSAGSNYVFVRGSIGTSIVHQAGDATVITSSTLDHIWFDGKNSTDFTIDLIMPSAPRLVFSNGEAVILGGLFGDIGMGPQPAEIGSIRFEDRAFTKEEFHTFVTQNLDTNADQTIYGSDLADTITLDQGGIDTVEPYYGDDTILVRSAGNKTIGISSGNDTLNLATYASTDVTRAIVGNNFVITTPDGILTLSGGQLLRNGSEGPIERVVFSDVTMEQFMLLDWMDAAP